MIADKHHPDDYHAGKTAAPLFQTPGKNSEGKQMQLICECDEWLTLTYER
ncbi:MAG: hypothetical protein KJO47_03165 [Gammaproteobacteria bacterium]|nr:hypothetical protein [Gammaproteobacteria bacterium]